MCLGLVGPSAISGKWRHTIWRHYCCKLRSNLIASYLLSTALLVLVCDERNGECHRACSTALSPAVALPRNINTGPAQLEFSGRRNRILRPRNAYRTSSWCSTWLSWRVNHPIRLRSCEGSPSRSYPSVLDGHYFHIHSRFLHSVTCPCARSPQSQSRLLVW
jgi:hypothetical protein